MGLKAKLSEDEFNDLGEDLAQIYEWSAEDEAYVMSWDVVKEHPGVSKVKQTANDNKRSVEKTKAEHDRLVKKLGPLAHTEDLDLSEYGEEDLEPVLKYLRGETKQPPTPGGGQSDVDPEKIKRQARKPLEEQLEALKQERDQKDQTLRSILVDQELTSALNEVQVQGPFQRYLREAFRGKVKLQYDDEGNPAPVIEGESGEQSVREYMKEWAQTEEGQAFVTGNNGSGAPGGSRNEPKGHNPWSRESWNTTEQMRIAREAPNKAKRLAQAAGAKAPRV